MSTKSLLSKFAAVATGQVGVMALQFLRNVTLTRLVNLEDMAIISYFTMIGSALELIFEGGVSRYLVQVPEKDLDRTVGVSQAWAMLRGWMIGLVLLASAFPLSHWLSCPHAIAGFALLGLFPVIRGLMNLDYIRSQRSLSFLPTNAVEGLGQIVSISAIGLASIWIRDWRLGVVALLCQSTAGVVVSHLVAKHRYQWDWDKETARKMRAFSGPLVLNGILVMLTIYGDRFVLAFSPQIQQREPIPLGEIGAFNVVFALLFTLAMGLFRIVNSFVLPLLVQVRDHHDQLMQRTLKVGRGVVALAIAITFALALLGPFLVTWVFGAEYNLGAFLIALIAMGQALRLVRANTNLMSLALGDSMNILWSNLVRSMGLLFAYLAIYYGYGIVGAVIAGMIAESLALLLSLILLRVQHAFAVRVLVEPSICLTGAFAACLLFLRT